MTNRDESIQLYTALYRLGRQLHRCAHHLGHANSYYREQSRLLALIAENDGVIQRDLAEEMDVRPSSMTEMLVKMEQLGLVERRQDEKDQRVMHIFLTDQGKKAVNESQASTKALTDMLFKDMSEDEISQMLALAEKLSAHLDDIDSAGMEQSLAGHGHHRGFEGHMGGCCHGDEHGHGGNHYGHHGGYHHGYVNF